MRIMEKIKKARPTGRCDQEGSFGRACPKFKTIFLGKTAPKDARLKRLKYWCREFHRCGLTPCYGSGSYGNLSFRAKKGSDGFIITASGLKLKNNLKNSSFFYVTNVDMNKKEVSGYGARPPSSESLLHFAIYRKRKDVAAIFHGHCTELLKTASGRGIPVTSKKEPYGTPALVKSVLKILGGPARTTVRSGGHKFVIMKDHGFISLGQDMDRAGRRALLFIKNKDIITISSASRRNPALREAERKKA